jgi:hypothetical protein
MSHILVAGERFPIDRAQLVAYHCDGPEADWNLELVRGDESLWLAGTATPAPRTPDDLVGASVEVDLRSLDEVVGDLLGRPVTLYPGGQDVCALRFHLARSPDGLRFAVTTSCDWDHYLQTFATPDPVELTLEIDAVVSQLHPRHLPG